MNRGWLIATALVALLVDAGGAQEKVNLNTATKEQLVALGLTDSQAGQIIAHREKSGPLLQVDELLAIQQMQKETFEKMRDHVMVDE